MNRHGWLAFQGVRNAASTAAQVFLLLVLAVFVQSRLLAQSGITLLATTDLDCTWKLDGIPQGSIKAGDEMTVSTSLGKHFVQATSTDGDEWRIVVNVTQVGQELVEIKMQDAHQSRLATWTDQSTGLTWARQDNGSNVNWNQANNYCGDLRLGSYANWRLATIEELAGIYDKTREVNGWYIKGGIQLSGFTWSKSQGDTSREDLIFIFNDGNRGSVQRGDSINKRALCVSRSGEADGQQQQAGASLDKLHDGAPQSDLTHKQSTTPAAASDIVAMLTRAAGEKIELSGAEKHQMKIRENGYNYKEYIKNCQEDYYNDRVNQDGAHVCAYLAYKLSHALGDNSHAAELAYQRSCAFQHETGERCNDLGRFYEGRNDYATAMAVYLNAPNCEQEGDSCINSALALSNKMADKQLQATVLKRSCEEFSNPDSCKRLNREFGGSEDVAAARSRYQSLHNPNQVSSWAELGKLHDDDDPPSRQPKTDWRDGVISALQSMPGASDPNAILNAANQQSAQMLAIGAANDAARRQAAQDRLAAQQAAAQARLEAQQAAQQARLQQQQAAAVNSNASSNSVFGTTESSPSSTTTTANYATPISASCIREFWDPNNYNWLSFQNTCSQAVRVSFIAANPSDTYGISAKDLATGQAASTGWSQSDVSAKRGFVLYVCPAGYLAVNSTTDQPVRRANEDFRCKQQ